ncbi:MAG: TlpA disulfide reductase family protein [Phycisphaerales bacterium]
MIVIALAFRSIVALGAAGGVMAPATPPTAANRPSIDAPALVERIRAASRWADQARSLRIEWTDRWLSPEETSLRLSRLGVGGTMSLATDPAAPDAGRAGGGALLFDDNRARFDLRMPTSAGLILSSACFDGKDAWQLQRLTPVGEAQPHPGTDHLSLLATARDALEGMVGLTAWPVTENRTWWIGFGQANAPEHPAADFSVVGESVVDGCPCVILGTRFFDRWHVDPVAGDCRAVERRVIGEPGVARRAEETIRRERGLKVLEPREYLLWTQSLAPDERRSVEERYSELVAPSLQPLHTLLLGEWREVVPGGRFPFRQGVVFHGDGHQSPAGAVNSIRLTQATRVAVDEALPDDAFAPPTRSEGMQIEDMRLGGAVRWRHPHEPSDDEKRALAARAMAELTEHRRQEQARDALVGTPAPTFDGGGSWLNGRPPAADGFVGHVTVVTFTSRSCGPCQSVTPDAKALHGRRTTSGVDLIAVHAADDAQRVDRYVRDKGIEYPVYIDQQVPGARSFGRLFDAWRVAGIPHAFVVGADGLIKGHGDFRSMADLAGDLASAGTQKTGP